MPAFAKNPKFIIGTILVLWFSYVIYEGFQLEPIKVKLLPFAATIDFRVSAVIIGSAIFGSIVTIAIHWLWLRPSNSSTGVAAPIPPSTPASSPRSSTVA